MTMRPTSVHKGPVIELERVYREESPRLYRALLLFGGSPEVAADAVAEAFAQALGRGDALNAPDRWVWKARMMGDLSGLCGMRTDDGTVDDCSDISVTLEGVPDPVAYEPGTGTLWAISGNGAMLSRVEVS